MIQEVQSSAKLKIGWALMRVSTKHQAEVQHGSLEQQRHMLERWSAQQSEQAGHRYEITRFFEEDISGRGKALHKRMALLEIERAIDSKAIDFIVFEKVDRLARDMIYNLGLVKKAQENGVEVHEFESGKIDLRDRGSRLGFNIKNLLAEEYSLDLEEKIAKKQREARVNNGKDIATVPILGLDSHPTKRGMYVINPKEQNVVIDIFKNFVACGSIKKLAEYCHEKGYLSKIRMTKEKADKEGNIRPPKPVGGEPLTPKLLRALLSNSKIRGYSFFEDTWNQFPKMRNEAGLVRWEYPHGPVVPTELFEQAQKILDQNKKYNSRIRGTVYLVSGLLYFEDGTKFTGAGAAASEYQYYHCPKHRLRISKDKVERAILSRVKEYLSNSEILKKLISEANGMRDLGVPLLQEEVLTLRKQLLENQKVVDGFSNYIRQSALNGGNDLERVIRTITDERDKAETQRMLIERQLALKEQRLRELKDQSRERTLREQLREVLENFDSQEDIKKRNILQLIISRIIVHKTNKLELWIKQEVGDKSDGPSPISCGAESEFGREGASYLATAKPGSEVTDLILSETEESTGLTPALGGVTQVERISSKDQMAGQPELRRTLSSPKSKKVYLIEKLDFICLEEWRSKTFLEENYVKEGRSIAEIAKQTLSSRAAVREALIQFKIPIREPGKPGRRPAQVPYGYRRSDGLLVCHLGEQRVIQSVRKMSSNGLSYRQICRFLTSIGVPTKNRGRTWQPEMIRRVLAR